MEHESPDEMVIALLARKHAPVLKALNELMELAQVVAGSINRNGTPGTTHSPTELLMHLRIIALIALASAGCESAEKEVRAVLDAGKQN